MNLLFPDDVCKSERSEKQAASMETVKAEMSLLAFLELFQLLKSSLNPETRCLEHQTFFLTSHQLH